MVCIRIELGGNGHKPPGQKSPGQKTPRTKAPPDKNPPGPGHSTSGDIFYCSGSRQLNHSSLSVVAVIFFINNAVCWTVFTCFYNVLACCLTYTHYIHSYCSIIIIIIAILILITRTMLWFSHHTKAIVSCFHECRKRRSSVSKR